MCVTTMEMGIGEPSCWDGGELSSSSAWNKMHGQEKYCALIPKRPLSLTSLIHLRPESYDRAIDPLTYSNVRSKMLKYNNYNQGVPILMIIIPM